jgi:hypothetical protein
MKFYKITQKKKGEELYHINSEATFITFFFLIKCKNCIDQKEAGDQQYKEKGTKVP